MIDERNDSKSLCEKSMKVVANIIKLSSFSIAKMSLGEATGHPTAAKGRPTSVTDSDTFADGPMSQPPLSSGMSEKLQSRSKPYSFVMQPEDGGNESLEVRGGERDDGDGKFSAYIKKVHEKNRSNLHEAAKLSPYMLPPPPTPPSLRRK
ncbi:hypothetical protein F3Y22_tig00014304pilonHSYRG00114 [Hibiscus syriacus]|uniref:Uncharacterized protein n=1 Tax=Hibiscus syriacus TaxID=106335 RepID=A0A6A3C0B4_HIBSY|nr:hypothetical protein F3Y22_tig00014304pilonHSYRG00114 [Hibiscus syriacus]